MSETKSKPIRLVSWEDLFINILFSWIGKRILDFIWENARIRIKFVGETHILRYLFVMFGEDALLFIFGWLIGIPYEMKEISRPQDMTESEFRTLIQRFLILHMRYHEYMGNRPCRVCPVILFHEKVLKKYVLDQNLYPSFVY